LLAGAKRFPAALEVARKATVTFPRSGAVFRMKGAVEVKMSLFTDAVRSYSRAVALEPTSLDAKIGLASAQWSAGMRAEARLAFEELLKQHAGAAVVYEMYGTLLLAGDSGLDTDARARSLLNKALVLDGSRPEPHYQLGVLDLKENTPEALRQAREQLEAAARLGRNDSTTHYNLARVYRRLELTEEAAKEMRLYEQLKAAEANALPGQAAAQGK